METLRYGSFGPIVELLQSILKKLGYYKGNITGRYGEETQKAVAAFQKSYGLLVDGIVQNRTWRRLHPYINGYSVYTVKLGDTLYNIAEKFDTSIYRIIVANPNINLDTIYEGQEIIIPFGNIINTNISYSFRILDMNINALSTVYPFLEVGSIGRSVLGRNIPYIRIGRGKKEVFYNASFHANEWITTPILMNYIEEFSKACAEGTNIYGYSAREIYDEVSLYIVPMVNPDGVDLVTGDIKSGMEVYASVKEMSENYPDIPFPNGWKANINGVDLNLQYPAGWEQAKKTKFSQGYTKPGPRDYVGEFPLSESESKAVYNFTIKHDFKLILAYHTQGKVIYWKYLDYLPEKSEYIAERFSESSGYLLEETPFESSFAGYKDWFIQEYNRPGYTIEAGLGENPLPISQFDTIYSENIGILTLGAVLS